MGRRGEDLAAAWYARHGGVVVARNWRCRDGELDLVVRDGPWLVFVEVKARTSDRFGHPAESVTPAKQRRLRRLAMRFLDDRQGAGVGRIRFDVVSVLGGEVRVDRAAF
ncbi:MAG: YraN family protein [Acidimicrobiia bacterium]